ncbi:MAG: TVP38/TMEM64 family protein, partial [Firmicutes bacterium]|nr:TVP38/TMEM64 family protein [Bacillota bacterium]
MKDREKTKTIIKAAFFVLLIVVVPLILFLTNREFFAQFESIEDVEDFIAGYGHLSGLVYIVFQIFQVVISVIPGEVFQVAAGYLFGPFWGVIYAIIGCLLGEAVAFGLARVLGQGFVRLFMSEEQFNKYKERLNSNKAYTLCFILYLIPGIPKDILCYVAGASEIKFLPFLIISMVGRLPGLIGSIVMGSLVDKGNYMLAAIILGIACVAAVLGFIYRNKLSDFMDRLREK